MNLKNLKFHLLLKEPWVTCLGAVSLPEPEVHGDIGNPNERAVLFCLIAVERHSGYKGIRFVRFRAGFGVEDLHDRALFGIGYSYNFLIIEIAWVRFAIC